MRSIRYFGNGTLKMVEAPEPEIKRADELKIRVAYCGVCGSDLHFKRAELDFLFEGDEGSTWPLYTHTSTRDGVLSRMLN